MAPLLAGDGAHLAGDGVSLADIVTPSVRSSASLTSTTRFKWLPAPPDGL